jgi:hypothetical protein
MSPVKDDSKASNSDDVMLWADPSDLATVMDAMVTEF